MIIKELKQLINDNELDEILAKKILILDENLSNAPDSIGKAIAAVSNEACLSDQNYGFIRINSNLEKVEQLIKFVSNSLRPERNFQISQLNREEVLIAVDAAPTSVPVSFAGHFFGLEENKIIPLSFEKFDNIRYLTKSSDWSSEINYNAKYEHLDNNAIKRARNGFRSRFMHLEREIDTWNDSEFLTKVGLIKENKITNGALLLLAKEDTEHLYDKAAPAILWVNRDTNGNQKGFQHFSTPFILNIENLLSKISNLKYDYSIDTDFAPIETTKYDQKVLRELIINSIVHNDYTIDKRVQINEYPDKIEIINRGALSQDVTKSLVLNENQVNFQRNACLLQAMFKLNLLDNINDGILKSILIQRNRNFPLPDLTRKNINTIQTTIYGKVINKNYTEKLVANKDLNLIEVYLLDKVQKGEQITEEQANSLRNKKLISGRFPDIQVASKFSSKEIAEPVSFVPKKFYSNDEIKDILIDYLKKKKEAGRQEIDDLLLDKYPADLSEDKRRNKVKNLLYQLSRVEQVIENNGSATKPIWVLAK